MTEADHGEAPAIGRKFAQFVFLREGFLDLAAGQIIFRNGEIQFFSQSLPEGAGPGEDDPGVFKKFVFPDLAVGFQHDFRPYAGDVSGSYYKFKRHNISLLLNSILSMMPEKPRRLAGLMRAMES